MPRRPASDTTPSEPGSSSPATAKKPDQSRPLQKGKARPAAMEVDDDPSSSDEDEEEQEQANKNHLYDPDQEIEELRKIRKSYRDEIANAEEQRSNLNGTTTASLTKAISRSNNLFGRVRRPAEATLDSKLLIMHADMGALKARNLRLDKNAFDTDDFVGKLAGMLGSRNPADEDDDDEDSSEQQDDLLTADGWLRVSRVAARFTYRVPTLDFMIGPLAIDVKRRAPQERRQRAKDKPTGPAVRPQQITEEDVTKNEHETSAAVHKLHSLLKRVGGDEGIDFFVFVINPKSFGQTIENLFWLSFLFKEGRASLDTDEEDTRGPILLATEAMDDAGRAEAAAQDLDIRKRQIVMQMDMETWQAAIDAYGLTESTIPHREEQSERTKGAKWYA